jgi:hypothetical protein
MTTTEETTNELDPEIKQGIADALAPVITKHVLSSVQLAEYLTSLTVYLLRCELAKKESL